MNRYSCGSKQIPLLLIKKKKKFEYLAEVQGSSLGTQRAFGLSKMNF